MIYWSCDAFSCIFVYLIVSHAYVYIDIYDRIPLLTHTNYLCKSLETVTSSSSYRIPCCLFEFVCVCLCVVHLLFLWVWISWRAIPEYSSKYMWKNSVCVHARKRWNKTQWQRIYLQPYTPTFTRQTKAEKNFQLERAKPKLSLLDRCAFDDVVLSLFASV